MLFLKRMIYPNEFITCDATGQVLMYGDFYYYDDETGKNISAKHYHSLKEQRRKDMFDNSILENAQSLKEYEDTLKKAEQEYLSNELLDKPMFGKDSQNRQREAGTWP